MNHQCAPSKKQIDNSCYDLESLVKIANAYNGENKNKNKIIIKYDKKYLVSELEKNLSPVCDKNHMCWMDLDFVKNLKDDNIMYNTFRSIGPKDSLEWLSTVDIDKVIKQYAYIHKDFRFYGALPLDFNDLPFLGVTNLNFDNIYKEGVHKLGFVFNLDKHHQSGSHWVAMYSDLQKSQIYFFDSYGYLPKKRIAALMAKLYNFCKKKNGNVDIKYNKHRHQFKNSECGVYSINFILRLLQDGDFKNITENITKDDEITKCRKTYFNTKK
jgi:hypothetical protein